MNRQVIINQARELRKLAKPLDGYPNAIDIVDLAISSGFAIKQDEMTVKPNIGHTHIYLNIYDTYQNKRFAIAKLLGEYVLKDYEDVTDNDLNLFAIHLMVQDEEFSQFYTSASQGLSNRTIALKIAIKYQVPADMILSEFVEKS